VEHTAPAVLDLGLLLLLAALAGKLARPPRRDAQLEANKPGTT